MHIYDIRTDIMHTGPAIAESSVHHRDQTPLEKQGFRCLRTIKTKKIYIQARGLLVCGENRAKESCRCIRQPKPYPRRHRGPENSRMQGSA